ncbi:YrbL family protein [Loktanella sp. DJP18]|uniref:YrbL family protein n=1 Tax=Loktanella sp. DJP18 TaxID=3409788 RepID=UPI003BB78239
MPYLVVDFDRPIGEGTERRVVDHPERPGRAVKVYNERRPQMVAKGMAGCAYRFSPAVRNRRQRRELECFLDLHMRGMTASPDLPIASIVGFCQTSHGPELEVEKIRRTAASDEAAPNLRWLLARPHQRPALPGLLNDLMDRLDRFGIYVSDANHENLMLSDVNGQRRLVMVDGFGDFRLIRLFPHSPFMIRRSIRRAFRAHAKEWGLAWDDASGRFAVNLP